MAIAERVPSGLTFIEMTLTEEEAHTLWLVCHRVGGDPAGRRGDIDAIRDALTEAGVTSVAARGTAFDDRCGRGSITLY
jgi:hypothetical protein